MVDCKVFGDSKLELIFNDKSFAMIELKHLCIKASESQGIKAKPILDHVIFFQINCDLFLIFP